MSTTPSSAARIRRCRRATRPSRTEGGTSSRDQLINPRRTALARRHGKQTPRSPGQDLAAFGRDAHRIAVHEIPDLRMRSEEHTSELQSRPHLVCRLLLEKKKHSTQHETLPLLKCHFQLQEILLEIM